MFRTPSLSAPSSRLRTGPEVLIGALSRWLATLPVRGKLNVALTVQLVMLALGCTATLLTMRELAVARTVIGKSEAIIDQLGALRSEILQEQAAVRGFIISGKAEFLDPHLANAIELGRLVQELRVQVADDPAQAARLGQLDQLINDWHSQVAQPNIEFARNPATRHLAQERVAEGEGERRVDAIRQLCQEMIAGERARLDQEWAVQLRSEKILIGIALLTLILGSVAGLCSVGALDRLLARPLSGLASLLPRLDGGEAVDVPHRERRDEVGVLARAIDRLRDTRLQQVEAGWVRERSVQIIAALQLCESEALFGEVLLRRLSESLEAGYALAYRWNERNAELEWCAAYGLPDPDVVRRRFRLGEGLVGQCIVERRWIELTPVPDGYLRVVSGLGAALPRVLLFVPVTARGETVAVLELGLLHDLQPRHRELIEQTLLTTGLAWQALARSLRTRELLAESEAQATVCGFPRRSCGHSRRNSARPTRPCRRAPNSSSNRGAA